MTENWFKWGWYFTLTVESGVEYPSTKMKWDTVESDFLLPQNRLYGGGVGIIQFTSENYELLRRIVKNGYDMNDFPNGTIKNDLIKGVKTIDWFKSSRSPEGGLFNVNETIAIKNMLKSEQGIESQAYFNKRYFFENNRTATNAIKNSKLSDDMKAFLVNIIVLRPASVIPLINSNPKNLDELVSNTLAIPQLSSYKTRMNNIANGLKSININDKPPIDIDDIMDGTVDEPKDGVIDLSPIQDMFGVFTEHLLNEINKLLTRDIYYYGHDKTIGNTNIQIKKVLNNMYKIKLTDLLKDTFKSIVKKGIENLNDIIDSGLIISPPENPINSPENPVDGKVFPVDYTKQGVNFWSPPYNDNLKRNMEYGTRTNGKWHNGYDIGGGGINHKIYAITSGTVTNVGVIRGYGTIIQIKHDTDEYYSFYAHLVSNSPVVKVGDKVEIGQHIGTMGNSGGNYAIHLHVEITTNDSIGNKNNSINPREYLEVYDDNKTKLNPPTTKLSNLVVE